MGSIFAKRFSSASSLPTNTMRPLSSQAMALAAGCSSSIVYILALVRAPPAVAALASSRPARQKIRGNMVSIQSPLVGWEIHLPAQISDLSQPQDELGHHDDSPTRVNLSAREANK